MTITEFFDCKNKRHLMAYRHLARTGTWPKGFLPETVSLDAGWDLFLAKKIAIQVAEEVTEDIEIEKVGQITGQDIYKAPKIGLSGQLFMHNESGSWSKLYFNHAVESATAELLDIALDTEETQTEEDKQQ